MEDLQKLFDDLQQSHRYLELKDRCERLVVEWRWATEEMYHPQPFWRENENWPHGRWLKDVDTKPKHFYLHGFDDSGRVVLIRALVPDLGPPPRDHLFFVYEDDAIYEMRVSSRGISTVSCFELTDGRVSQLNEISPSASHLTSSFVYVGDRLVQEKLSLIWRSSRLGTFSRVCDYSYADDGTLDSILAVNVEYGTDNPISKRYALYRQPRKGESMREVALLVEERLLDQVPKVLAAVGISDSVYCLLLVYDAENDLLPPSLALGSESHRQVAREKYGKQAGLYLWNPADFVHFNKPELELTDQALLDACSLMNQRIAMKDSFAPARKLLNNVAAKLSVRDWSGILNVTPDFIVVAVDLESQDDMSANMKKSVRPDKIKALKSQGLV